MHSARLTATVALLLLPPDTAHDHVCLDSPRPAPLCATIKQYQSTHTCMQPPASSVGPRSPAVSGCLEPTGHRC
jgi:hypothetical protein